MNVLAGVNLFRFLIINDIPSHSGLFKKDIEILSLLISLEVSSINLCDLHFTNLRMYVYPIHTRTPIPTPTHTYTRHTVHTDTRTHTGILPLTHKRPPSPCVVAVQLLVPLSARKHNILCVEDDYVVTHIHCEREQELTHYVCPACHTVTGTRTTNPTDGRWACSCPAADAPPAPPADPQPDRARRPRTTASCVSLCSAHWEEDGVDWRVVERGVHITYSLHRRLHSHDSTWKPFSKLHLYRKVGLY